MKTRTKGFLIAGAFALAGNGLFAAQTDTANGWFEQRHIAKYGRPSPMEEARLKAERESTAFRAEPIAAAPADNWFEQRYITKYGRPSPLEEARLKAERETTAFRAEPAPAPANSTHNWLKLFHKAKHGHDYPPDNGR
jgi:hypothetical protein